MRAMSRAGKRVQGDGMDEARKLTKDRDTEDRVLTF